MPVEPDAASVSITLPGDYVNEEWPNEGGFASHVVQNVRADPNFQRVWRRDVGSADRRNERVNEGKRVAVSTALISVSDKSGVVELASGLAELGATDNWRAIHSEYLYDHADRRKAAV